MVRNKRLNLVLAFGGLVVLASVSAEAGAYRRPMDAANVAAPIPSQYDSSSYQDQNGHNSNRSRTTPSGYPAETDVNFAWNGMEGPAYGYGYTLNMPADGNWRFIEPRCYGSRTGQVCVDGHWVRRKPGRCEEVTAHSVRRGNYIRMVPPGPVASCRR
ncbi:hypothetical protein [Aquidulcibacter sp.]|uniref:hypothetical protein n=1 Tax=Aquidulcibacter sp. TaxID=2052990 RepID=UPI0025B8BD58|nr:hypothetical protein [Aquidulcibacter sp.]MCA3698134.1 hypothetical protein [Aquidulcibacter sp.]